MVFCVLVLRPRLNRIINITLAALYAVSIIAATIGEWSYYVLGSLIESALFAAIIFYAWTWPKDIGQTNAPVGLKHGTRSGPPLAP